LTNGAQSNGKSATPNASKSSSLKPTAPEFKPQTRARYVRLSTAVDTLADFSSSVGVATPKASITLEVEDGEVDDAKASTSATATGIKPNRDVDHKPDELRPTIEPRKSEILDRRDQFKRNNAVKASTPPPSHANIPPRPDARGSILDRASPSLPNRPDAPLPSRDLLDRHPRYSDRRDGRDSRPTDLRGVERPSNRPGDRPREYAGGDRRPVEPMPRDFGRSSDRGPGSERARLDPPRWTADSGRDNHDRTTNGARVPSDGRLSRDMAPPRLSSDRGPTNPERIPQVNPERQELINPERAALISSDKDTGRSESPRRSREDTRERGSRPQSPRRHTSEKNHSDSRRDDRLARNAPVESHPSSRSRAEESQPPPAGPRSERTADRGPSNDRVPFQPPQPLSRNMDLDHGRLNAGARQQPDPNFGRLNPAPPSDIPSGPRDRTSRGNRPTNLPAPRRDGRSMETPRPPTPEKQPPTGPAGNRHPRRTASGQFEPIVTTGASAPSTPVVASPATGIHPDRLKALGSSVPQVVHNQPASPGVAPPIHPDRLRALTNDSPVKSNPQRPIHNDRGRPNMPPLATAVPPSGPKGSQSSPTIPQNGFAAPTGPASATERAARGNRHQLAGINTIIQQSNQGPNRMNSRGRGRMGSGMGPDTPNSGPPTPSVVLPPPPPPPPPGPPPSNKEAGRELINPQRADLITSGVAPVDERDRDRSGRRERSGRHSRRSSRSPARERDAKRGSEEDRLRSDYRDRTERPRGDRGEAEKDRQTRSSPLRESAAGRDGAGREGASGRDVASGRDSGRDRERERDRERDSGRRDGRDGRERDITRDAHEAGWNGERGGSERGPSARSRDLRGENRGEERRDSRGNREDGGGGRKRHSDEGVDRGRDTKRARRA
jgi:THO complex subunit 2